MNSAPEPKTESQSRKVYPWKRFWCPRAGEFSLADGGFLADPDTENGRLYNPDVIPFEALAETPCLVLLGEPGIGKTQAMRAEQGSLDARAASAGGRTLWLNLNSIGSEGRLQQKLFENPTFRDWVGADYVLHLYLDSLDECLERIDTLSALLLDEFQSLPTKRLFLRIACRTAVWPGVLERGLKGVWADDALSVYELMPLRRKDVELAADVEGVPHGEFLEEVTDRLVVPFAAKPVTLIMLLRQFEKSGALPATQKDIYRQGCERLCEECNEERRASSNTNIAGRYDSRQRLAIAARIAAVMTFANRSAITTGLTSEETVLEDVSVTDLCGGYEKTDGTPFDISETAIKETLDTGLFSSRGPERMGWAHKTYQDFLTAKFLGEHGMGLPQIKSLLTLPSGGGLRVVPQLGEVAAWLGVMLPDVGELLREQDPDSLLDSDVDLADDESRAELTKTALRMSEEKKALGWGRTRYRKLRHPGLDAQLKPYITDRARDTIVRRVAIEIAEECSVRSLQNDLAEIALDRNEPYGLRCNAASAVNEIGDGETKSRLRPLAVGDRNDDQDDSLKGYALMANWPERIAAVELFPVLTDPGRTGSAYTGFILGFARHLSPSDLPIALDWVAEHHSNSGHYSVYNSAVDEIMLRGLQHLGIPAVLDAWVRVVFARLEAGFPIVSSRAESKLAQALKEDDDRRRMILRELFLVLAGMRIGMKTALRGMLAGLGGRNVGLLLLTGAQPRLFLPEKDAEWLIHEYEASSVPKLRQFLLQLLREVIFWRSHTLSCPEQAAILAAAQKDPALADALSWLLKPVVLDSDEAKQMKANCERAERSARPQAKVEKTGPRIQDLESRLGQFEAGQTDAWTDVTYLPGFDYHGISLYDEWESDMTSLLGQSTDPSATKVRTVRAARTYLEVGSPQTVLASDNKGYYYSARAGVAALLLLRSLDPTAFSELPPSAWNKWAGAVLAFAGLDGEHMDDLVSVAYEHAPEQTVAMLSRLIDKENQEGNHIWITRKVSRCWDERIATAIRGKAREEGLKSVNVCALLAELLAHGDPDTRHYAETLLGDDIPSDRYSREVNIFVASQLVRWIPDADWPIVWSAVVRDTEFGAQVLELVADQHDLEGNRVNEKLTADQLAVLFIWSVRTGLLQIGSGEGRTSTAVTPAVALRMWLEGIPGYLASLGTVAACTALRKCQESLPHLEWNWLLLSAETRRLHNTWSPVGPTEVLKLSQDPNRRIVSDGGQLLDTVLEALRRIHDKVLRSTAGFGPLWDTRATKQPKDENEISDYLKDRIDEELGPTTGVIVNREVQTRRGERTDIYVDASVQHPESGRSERVSVVIEVKGCWHQKLCGAVKTQLVSRYLKDSACKHGLYLVVWSNGDAWNPGDPRRETALRRPREAMVRKLDKTIRTLNQLGEVRVERFVFDISWERRSETDLGT